MKFGESDTRRLGRYSNRELLRLLGPLFRPQVPHFIGAFLLLVLVSSLMIAGPLLVRRAIDDDIGGRDLPGLQTTVLIYLAVQFAHLVLLYLLRNWLEWVGQTMMAGLRRQVFDHLLELPLSFHDRNTPGQLISRVESDTQALRMLFTTTAVMLAGDVLLFIGMFIAMAVVSPRLTLVTAFLLPALVGLTLYFQRRIHPIFVEVRAINSQVSGRLTEFLQAMPVLQAFERQRWALADFLRLNKRKYDTQVPGEKYIILWFNLLFMLETLAFAAILGLGGYWALAGLVTIGTLAMFIGYVRRFFEPLFRLSEQLAVIQRAFAAAERIFSLLHEPITTPDPPQPVDWPGLKSGVEFEHVWFRYADDGDWILKDVSFTLPTGQSWALVGPTGSGKTTIVSLLLRFYDPQQGRILIDGIDVRELKQRNLRQRIGMVLQDIYLFPGDLEANLTLGRDCSREQIEATAQATLSDRFIRQLPGGYNANLAERGSDLSYGQRQLLSFTRALVGEPQLLILDEATSAVDPATEAAIGKTTRKSLEDRTALVIAHRLSTIRDCDSILVLQHGEIVQQGNHDQLAAEDGLYRTLHELQFSNGDASSS